MLLLSPYPIRSVAGRTIGIENCTRVAATLFSAASEEAPSERTATLKPPPPLTASDVSAVTATSNLTIVMGPPGAAMMPLSGAYLAPPIEVDPGPGTRDRRN